MAFARIEPCLERVHEAETPRRTDLERLLGLTDPADIERLFDFADEVRRRHVGDAIPVRAIVEFSNHCRNRCAYCGLQAGNAVLERYRLDAGQVLKAAGRVADMGIGTVVLQSGEDPRMPAEWLGEVIERIKTRFDMAVTLSVGERSRDDYTLWRRCGANRYLLKIETGVPDRYERLHPAMSFENRRRCLKDLAELGYQVGSGIIVGLRGQTIATLADDIIFLKACGLDMVSVGPFIPHPHTALGGQPAADLMLTLKALAVARILMPDAHMPATTALAYLDGVDRRAAALAAGANVIMVKCTPYEVRRLYDIYPGGAPVDADTAATLAQLEATASILGRQLDYSRGDCIRTLRGPLPPSICQPGYYAGKITNAM
ncbi:MAG TPA: [FeFe] hydrogenase H-cluster radical SAM maturase HydE [Phycisphaerales bacterium]|mgnify:CR=1 FL=1|nr:[FeFe] hydrogenase H-cluster radical SAM maturase HydE [Phycisphaerales bacterium]